MNDHARDDDLRKLIEEDFPKLAHSIAKDALSKIWLHWIDKPYKHRFHPNWCDYSKPMHFEGVQKSGGGDSDVYAYNPMNNWGNPQKEARIIFYNPRVIDISKIETGNLNILNPNDKSESLTVDSYLNDTNSVYVKRTEVETEKEREETHSFGVEVSQEFRLKMGRNAGIDMEVFSAGGDMEVELTSRIEARTDHEWRKSDTVRSAVEETYTVNPKCLWELSVERSMKHIRQDIFMTGLLDCSVWIVHANWFDDSYMTLRELFDVFRGVKGKDTPIGWYFKDNPISDEIVDSWEIPNLTLNVPMEGKRTRYSRTVSKETPIEETKPLSKAELDEIPELDGWEDIDVSEIPDLEEITFKEDY